MVITTEYTFILKRFVFHGIFSSQSSLSFSINLLYMSIWVYILLLSLFYTNHLVSVILFNYDYLNSTTILLCL